MAGLFDFKSAEDILKERQDATRKNVMEAFNQPGQYKVRGERTANAVGKILGLLGGQLFADSPEEQVAGKMQRANQLAESLKPVEGESQSDFYNRVAVSFNDAGYSQNSLRALTLAKQAEEAEAKEAQRIREVERKYKYDEEKAEAAALAAAKDRTERFNIDLGKQTVDLEEGLAGLIAIKGVFKDVESGKVDIDKIDLPGIGLWDRTKQDNRTREVKGIVQGLQNVILKARSGGAVTESEADRLLVEAQQLRTEKDVYQFYKRIETEINDKLTKVVGSYPQDIQDSYYSRTKANSTPPPSVDEDGTTSGELTPEAAAFL